MTASPPTVPTHPEYDEQQRADYWQGVRDGQSRPRPEPDDYGYKARSEYLRHHRSKRTRERNRTAVERNARP